MASRIFGIIPILHSVDSSGSFTLDVPLQLPEARFKPELSLSYHSAATDNSVLGRGWVLKGVSVIERALEKVTQRTIDVASRSYFTLDGQRLVNVGHTDTSNGDKKRRTEYRFEVEQWSRIYAVGDDPKNPEYWEEQLPGGGVRLFGETKDSKTTSLDGKSTSSWAISQAQDLFTNYITFSYTLTTGVCYLKEISYGGNLSDMKHTRKVSFEYGLRQDVVTRYSLGRKIILKQQMQSITTYISTNKILAYELTYSESPLTLLSRLSSVEMKDANRGFTYPLTFTWTGRKSEDIFDSPYSLGPIKMSSPLKNPQVMLLDTNGNSSHDIVIASKETRTINGAFSDIFSIKVLPTTLDSHGFVKLAPLVQSDNITLPPSGKFLPLDVNGNGTTDLLHFARVGDSYPITILLSGSNGYERLDTFMFKPPTMGGTFHTGDFFGDGNVGLVYVYPEQQKVKLVQFEFDGRKMKMDRLAPLDGPQFTGNITKLKVVVGDLDGDGVDGLFLLCPDKNRPADWEIAYVDAINGRLSRVQALPESAKIRFTNDTTILPFHADGDSKTSLLFLSKDEAGDLQFQLVRNVGGLLNSVGDPTNTRLPFNRSTVTISRVVSPVTLDVMVVVDEPRRPVVHVFHFDSSNFRKISWSGFSPFEYTSASGIRWADFRGVGLSDCTSISFSGQGMTVSSMQCLGLNVHRTYIQPMDCISGYRQTLGLLVQVHYSPLSDSRIYESEEKTTTSLINAFAGNCAAAANLGDPSSAQQICRMRAESVSFPHFVVASLAVTPGRSMENILDYKYKNARIQFGGRGWLGFEAVTTTNIFLETTEMVSYNQYFPFIGQIRKFEKRLSTTEELLESSEYTWESVDVCDRFNKSAQLKYQKETFYDRAQLKDSKKTSRPSTGSYSAQVSFAYDGYGNITKTTIKSSQANIPSIDLVSSFEPLEKVWYIRNKTREAVETEGHVIRQTKYKDVTLQGLKDSGISADKVTSSQWPGSSWTVETSNWISSEKQDGTWLTTTTKFGRFGEKLLTKGSNLAEKKYQYDDCGIHVVRISTAITSGEYSDETFEFENPSNLASGLPSAVKTPKGLQTNFKYDILGRTLETSLGSDPSSTFVMEKVTYDADGGLIETRQIYNGLEGENHKWREMITKYDGYKRAILIKESMPDDPSKYKCNEIDYDGAGRIASRLEPYLNREDAQHINYSYDARSRLTEQRFPGNSFTHKIEYFCDDGTPKVQETLSTGTRANNEVTSREMAVLPNADSPSAGNFLKLCVTKRVDEGGRSVMTKFDALARPVEINDGSSSMSLELKYDGLSREISRCLVRIKNEQVDRSLEANRCVNNHSTVRFEDDARRTTLRNELTKKEVVTETDYCQRSITKKTAEDTVNYTYKDGQLATVKSTQGHFSYSYKYSDSGYLRSSEISIDSKKFKFDYNWTKTGQLERITNPDKSDISCSFQHDGITPHILTISHGGQDKASISFFGFDNAYSKPSRHRLQNGIISESRFNKDGILYFQLLMNQGDQEILRQSWSYTPFNRISSYKVSYLGAPPDCQTYRYDRIGQVKSVNDHNFSYSRGNLGRDNHRNFLHKTQDYPWQLTNISGSSTHDGMSFQYSVDGNRISEKDAFHTVTSEMSYDSQGQLTKLNNWSFVYDYTGRLIKASHGDHETIYYPTESHELQIDKTGERHTSYLIYNRRLASVSSGGGEYHINYFHHDHLGSTIATSDASGAFDEIYKYDAFGCIAGDPPRPVGKTYVPARYTYCGKQMFRKPYSKQGFYNFGSRFYDPETGRFLSLDKFPIDIDNLSPTSFNLYAFSQNDPINFVDLFGYAPVPWWHWAVGVTLVVGGIAVCATVPFAIGMMAAAAAVGGAGITITVTGAVAVGTTMAGSALVGAGLSAIVTDSLVLVGYAENDEAGWRKQILLGATFGAIGGGIGAAASTSTPAAVSLGTLQREGVRRLPQFVASKLLSSAGVDTVAGALLGGVQQMTTNALDDAPILTDVGLSMTLGAIGGFGVNKFAGGSEKALNRSFGIGSGTLRSTRSGGQSPALTLASAGVSKNAKKPSYLDSVVSATNYAKGL
ncbi:hypothetical protein AMATHDRAFT_7456 [Amanita thiersii Skay4041]|uniref:Insecticide toxin TcdB middle/N-terminal domain-containing protein n=1 Tax=Amanita thiersii Skay4041 TaxID=703135 RepID=A0A2A9NGA3_9AGAR|nr:hypothetical protein AMATHDRAFT_7456 [Amanita thiersii Skay4041]